MNIDGCFPIVDPLITDFHLQETNMVLECLAQERARYTVQYNTTVLNGSKLVQLAEFVGSNGLMTATDPLGASTTRFYRILAR